MAGAGDPVATGSSPSLDRPGGNVTGLSSGGAEVAGKSVELIRELAPGARRIGVFADETDPFAKPYRRADRPSRAQRRDGGGGHPDKAGTIVEAAFETLTGKRVDGLVIQGSIVRKEMLDLAIKYRLPALTSIRLGPPLGAPMSIVRIILTWPAKGRLPRQDPQGRQAGRPAGALPTKFGLILNLKTAKALGLDVPPTSCSPAPTR